MALRCAVTGGAGFIGRHLVQHLLAHEHYVVCIDDLSTGSQRNVQCFQESKLYEFRQHDLRRPLSVYADIVFNLACPASPVHYQRDPVRTLETAVLGTMNALSITSDNNKCRMLQASTSEVYGDAQVHPQPESYWGNVNTMGVRACYDEGKRCAETLCYDYRRQRGVDVRVARIFNTYGPAMQLNDGRVVSNFIVQALRGQDLTVYGMGYQTRSFCYVDDLIRGFMKLIEIDTPEFLVVNLGNPQTITVMELALLVLRLTGSKSKIVFKDLPEDDPKHRRPDIALAAEQLCWSPIVELEQGLRTTIADFQKRMRDEQ